MADGGYPSMTHRGAGAMPKLLPTEYAQRIPSHSGSRPTITSYQSSSLPSTPRMGACNISDERLTPTSVVKGEELASPRSARSESDTGVRPLGKALLAGCKFETGMTYSRRRIPYSLGGDRLERASAVPKKYLDQKEEEKLTSDMRGLFSRLIPSAESDERRGNFTQKLEKILNEQWPGNNIKVHVFGSSGNLLCTSDSDVDICITTPMKALERVCLLAKALADHGMERVVCVPNAKVPIVKIWDPELELACDMNVNNTLALENTRMIKTYVQIDERVRPLAMVIKHWTRMRILNDAALGGTLSSYTWICMIINFLQTRNPPVLPALHQRPHQRRMNREGKLSAFADDLESLRGYGINNKETIGELLFHFFRRYAHEVDFDKHVVSIREGRLISKQDKKWHLMQNNRLCVEEPFNTERNLGNTADDISFRGVHLELRRAFELLSEAKLNECCEQYVFPAVEEKIWIKPAVQPRPVLSRSLSQQGRTGKNGSSNRGGHTGPRHRAGVANRRASSAAATNNIPLKVNLHSQNLPNGQGPSVDRNAGPQLHEQLMQHMSLLQAQERELRLQMHQRNHANIHAQYTAQVQPLQVQGTMYPQHLNLDTLARHRSMFPGPMSAPLRKDQPANNGNTSSKQGPNGIYPSPPVVHTNPSSPSMTPAQPVKNTHPPLPEFRRSLHRSTTTDNSFTTLRSHSQPASDMRIGSQTARQIGLTTYPANFQGKLIGFTSLHQYQQAYLQQRQLDMQEASQTILSPRLGSLAIDRRRGDIPPHHPEYVGYYVDQTQPLGSQRVGLLPQIPAYHGTVSRGVSPHVNRLRSQTSRSPSPSNLGSRDRTITFYSAQSAPPSSPVRQGSMIAGSSRHNGPIIIDGSSETSEEYLTPPETQPTFYPMTLSEAASVSSEPCIDIPETPSTVTPLQDSGDFFGSDVETPTARERSMPRVLQFGDFPARATRRASPNAVPSNQHSADTQVSPTTMQNGHVPRELQNGLGIEHDERLIKKPDTREGISSPSRTSTSTKSGPKLDVPNMQPEADYASNPKSLSFLSPVREVRTPSPTATRSSVSEPLSKSVHARSSSLIPAKEQILSPLSAMTNGKSKVPTGAEFEAKLNGVNRLYAGLNGEPSSVSKSPIVDTKAVPSGWQQTGKKGKNSRAKGSISSLNEIIGERKGG
ncbi:hypothetical protein MMC13_002601 [Lambiella insularis]|nr:hypothetical protein [Lambiella insularis]